MDTEATIMKRLLTAACLFIVTVVSIVSIVGPTVLGQETKPASTGVSPAKSTTPKENKFPSDASVRAILQDMVSSGRAAGIVVGLLESDGSRRIVSYGSSGPNGLPLDGHSVFEIGSITKVFTGILLADMVRRGEVRLDDPIARYLPPDVKVPSRNGKAITLLDISTHSSGLPRMPNNFKPKDPGNPYADYSVQQLYEFLNGYELPRDPGASFEYSNLAMGLLGHALARQAGTTYEELVTKRILGPLGMRATRISLTTGMRKNLAQGHDGWGDPVSNWDIPTLAGAGGLRSTAADMLEFAAANLTSKKGPLYEAMRDSHIAHPAAAQAPNRMGLNWFISSPPGPVMLRHGGGTGGYSTFLALDLSGRRAVVVLTNSWDVRPDDLVSHLFDPAKPRTLPAVRLAVAKAFRSDGVAGAIARYRELKASASNAWAFDEFQLNTLGYWLWRRGLKTDAVAIFQLNVEMYPDASNPYDSLGEVYLEIGDTAQAIKNYKRSVELDPKNTVGIEALKKLGVQPAAEAPPIIIPEQELAGLAGLYINPTETEKRIDFYLEDGKLLYRAGSGVRQLSPLSQNRFKVVGVGAPLGVEMVFARPTAGGPMEVKVTGPGGTDTLVRSEAPTPTQPAVVGQAPKSVETKPLIDDTTAAKVDKLFAQWDKPDSPGCALGIVKDGRLIYKRGYGLANLEHNAPLSAKSVFNVMSMSKQFTLISILLLAQQGKLSIDDDIQKYFPEFPRYQSPITIRHLIHHTSGLRNYIQLMGLAGLPWENVRMTHDDFLELLVRQKGLNHKPGEERIYNNSNYFLLGQIVKKVSGKPLREFADENIFKPLGMTDTFFLDDRNSMVKNRATGYEPRRNGGFDLGFIVEATGSSGLYTSVEDLFLWDQNFYNNRLPGGQDLIREQYSPGKLNNGESVSTTGSVGQYKGLKTVRHGGGGDGFGHEMTRFPEQNFTVIRLCNAGDLNTYIAAPHVAEIFLADQFKELPEAISESATVTSDMRSTPEKELATLTGLYFDPVSETALRRIYLKDGSLMIDPNFNRGPSYILSPISENRFKIVGAPPEIVFTRAVASGPIQVKVISGGKTIETLDAVQSVTPTSNQLAEYTGRYVSDALTGAIYTLSIKNGKLVLQVRNGITTLVHAEPNGGQDMKDTLLTPGFADAFFAFDGSAIVRFTRNQRNAISGFSLSNAGVRRLRFDKQ
jgi:CubicO group peptidase (beta-lactamase class C family)